MVAVAVLDDQVMPEQYLPERIGRDDVQKLLRRITVRPSVEFSRRFPDQMPCRITVELPDGRRAVKEKTDYEGFQTRPMSWETALKKFERLAAPYSSPRLRAEIVSAVDQLDELAIADLSALLGRVRAPTT
jgi:2-methylcitrate dehydratase